MSLMITRFPLPALGSCSVAMPRGTSILTVTRSSDPARLSLWTLAETAAPIFDREFRIHEADAVLQQSGHYIATVILDDGSARHVFEVDR